MKFFEKYPFILICVGVLGISLSSILVKYSAAPSSVTAMFRLCWTVVLMTPVVLGSRHARREIRQIGWKGLILSILSGIFLAAHFVLWFESLHFTSVASSTTIVCTEVIWVALGYCLFLRGRLSWKAVCAISIAFLGSALIALADSGSERHLTGDILALLAAVAVAVYTLLGRVVRARTSTTVYTYLVYSACALSLVLTVLVQGYQSFGYGVSPILVGLGLAVVSTILGHSIFSWCLRFFSPAYVSASKLCEPVVAAVIAGFLFQEIPGPWQIFGCVLILGGVLLYSYLEIKKTRT